MERQIPDPLTLEDLRRDPDLIFAVHARGRRMRAEACSELTTTLIRRIRTWWPTPNRSVDHGYRLRTS